MTSKMIALRILDTVIMHVQGARAGDGKSRDTPKASRLLFASAESYLLSFFVSSFGASLFMLSSGFLVFLELFFFILASAWAFIGLPVFMES